MQRPHRCLFALQDTHPLLAHNNGCYLIAICTPANFDGMKVHAYSYTFHTTDEVPCILAYVDSTDDHACTNLEMMQMVPETVLETTLQRTEPPSVNYIKCFSFSDDEDGQIDICSSSPLPTGASTFGSQLAKSPTSNTLFMTLIQPMQILRGFAISLRL